MANLRWQLEELLEKGGSAIEPLRGKDIVIYGAGNCGRRVAQRAREAGLRPVAFIDARAKSLGKVDSVPCLSISDDEVPALAGDAMPVVIGIFNHATNLAPIRGELLKAGFQRIVTYPEFHEQFEQRDNFWLTRRSYYFEEQEAVLAGYDLFDDELSRQIYYDSIAYRLGAESSLQTPDLEHQYLPHDLPPPCLPMRLIDGGAFTGDTLIQFRQHGVIFEAVAAFEPDASNHAKLVETVRRCSDSLGAVQVFRSALGERTETATFSSGASSGSALDSTGSATIQVVALDEALRDFAPTFIKLDIEGAEPAALRGAQELIREYRPRLAICAYHKPDHLWSIAQVIHHLEPSYRLALRYHQWNGFDLVVYAFT